jgi:hypothetical protein
VGAKLLKLFPRDFERAIHLHQRLSEY